MSLASIPSSGVSLHGFATEDADPKHVLGPAISFKISDDLLEDVKRAHKAQGGLQLLTGSTPKIRLGSRTIDLTLSAEAFRHELYSASIDSLSDFDFAGILGHRAELKVPERKQSVGGDAALAALQHSLASYQQEKDAKAVNISDQLVKEPKNRWEAAKDSKKGHRRGISAVHTQGSPSGASSNQYYGTSTASMPVSASVERTKAMRTPLIHLLAMQPLSLQEIVRKTRIPKEEVEELLQKIGRQEGGLWELIGRAYKELDVWKFGYSTQEDRQAAVDNAIRAFDRQRLAPDDRCFQMLLPEKERDQGIVLSKLHLAPAPASSLLTPNATGSGDEGEVKSKSTANTPRLGPASTPKVGAGALSKRLFSKDPKKARAADDAKEKKRKEREAAATATAATNSDREGGIKQAARKKQTTITRTNNPKVKSAEIVHDSSDESSGEPIAKRSAASSSSNSSQPKSSAANVKSVANASAAAATSKQQKERDREVQTSRDEKSAPAKARPKITATATAGATSRLAGTPKTAGTPSARPAATAASKTSKPAALGGGGGKSTPNGGMSAPASQNRPQLSPQKGSSSRPTVPSPLGAARPRVASDVAERGTFGMKRQGAETPKGLGITNGVRKRHDTATSAGSNTPRMNGDHHKAHKVTITNGTKAPSTNGTGHRDEHALKRKHIDSPSQSQEDGRSTIKHRKTESTSSQSQKSQSSSVGAASSTDLRLHRSNSSDSTSSVMRDITYNQGVEEARRFRDIYYPQYATEYDRQMAMEQRGEKVPQKDRERLWDMHRRIQTMKLEMRIASEKEHDDES